ncbi:PD-(D/E)XK nuclease family transposase [Paenibacillus konkukensis]|uniref:PD-(D/E)XK nuclease family transposase n=1 Tax=Paenibacillus konkukensis TaxID=2020716 RepID=A0ABY4RM56_9BACL|nr:Rpn family recombination-promoting nuclease/putative transposase [Paenibacillus konkukensis]UQZ83005.1 PD-(D/E)XK nuclease family transposase [Paenibacillus konkukensis]
MELLDPRNTDKDAPQDKQSILDIKAKTTEGKLINIEMQLFNPYHMEKRTLFYWSNMYSHQIKKGGNYSELKKCVTINILNYSCLPKSIPVDGGLINWLLFLRGVEHDQWEVLTMNEPMLKKAMTTLEFLSQDAQTRMEYEARLKYLRDEASRTEGAKAEGIMQEKRQTARRLLARGYDISTIVDMTELSPEEIRALIQEH